MNNLILQQAGLTPERINALAILVTQAIENIDRQVEDLQKTAKEEIEKISQKGDLIRAMNKFIGRESIPESDIEELINEKVEEAITNAKEKYNYSMLLELHPILHELKFELSNE